MNAQNQYEAGLALNCLANICTPDIARDLAADVVSLLNSSRIYVRKKAVLALYRIFLKYPDALRPAFPRLKEKLEDMDNSVVSSAVNVICELARKNPKNYLALAPILFKILTSSSNNWMLIKIIKLVTTNPPHPLVFCFPSHLFLLICSSEL
jgi:AP-3 complex subunit delta-1